MKSTIILETPGNFSFRHTVYSHGWSDLLPFHLDEETWQLDCVLFDEESSKYLSAFITEGSGKLFITLNLDEITSTLEQNVKRKVRHILRVNDDLSGFYDLAKHFKNLSWIVEAKAGRLIRSDTVFEDLVKTICTTNCSWALTKSMNRNLVEKLGDSTPDGRKAFPTPLAMAGQTADFYRQEIRAGYRSPYFSELADSVVSGKIDPESWLNSDKSTAELKKEMKSIKGVGDYAAENLLKLVGRYDGLALDSWLRSQYYKKHNQEKVCDDKKIGEHYEKFGPWRGLAIWCDMTDRWLKLTN